jgi:hypothetical protein
MSVDAELLADRLPWHVTRFVGRETETAELEAMWSRACWSTSGVGTGEESAGDRGSEPVVS